MTEDEAREWVRERFSVSRETRGKLEAYVTLLLDEADHQNLISASTRDIVWARHIADSAQLMCHAGSDLGLWIDLGAGAGLPGMVVAILSDRPVLMIESRKGRVRFLTDVIASLGLSNASVFSGKVQSAASAAQAPRIISARAYAPLPQLLGSAFHLSRSETRWILPKGRNWQNELDNARGLWQGVFHVEQSVTDAQSAVLVIDQLRKRGRQS